MTSFLSNFWWKVIFCHNSCVWSIFEYSISSSVSLLISYRTRAMAALGREPTRYFAKQIVSFPEYSFLLIFSLSLPFSQTDERPDRKDHPTGGSGRLPSFARSLAQRPPDNGERKVAGSNPGKTSLRWFGSKNLMSFWNGHWLSWKFKCFVKSRI